MARYSWCLFLVQHGVQNMCIKRRHNNRTSRCLEVTPHRQTNSGGTYYEAYESENGNTRRIQGLVFRHCFTCMFPLRVQVLHLLSSCSDSLAERLHHRDHPALARSPVTRPFLKSLPQPMMASWCFLNALRGVVALLSPNRVTRKNRYVYSRIGTEERRTNNNKYLKQEDG